MTRTAEKKIRVLIVDDSAFMCKVLQEIINSDPQLEVVGQGRDGRDGVALAESLRPDVITMDINMPHVDGLQATELIMTQHPRPIVIVSSESREGAASTLKALELGAIDFVPKPSSGIDLDMKTVREELTRKLKMAAKVRVVRTATRSKLNVAATSDCRRHRICRHDAVRRAERRQNFRWLSSPRRPAGRLRSRVSCRGLPKDLPAAVFLVLHMPATFTKQFMHATRRSFRAAREGSGGQRNPAARNHLSLPRLAPSALSFGGKISLDAGDRIEGYRPCADLALRTDRRIRARDDRRRGSHRHGQRRRQGRES